MAVQTLRTVELAEDGAPDKVLVERLAEPENVGQHWTIRTVDSNTSTVYATDDDLRDFARAILSLVGERVTAQSEA